jgi:cytochrome P450
MAGSAGWVHIGSGTTAIGAGLNEQTEESWEVFVTTSSAAGQTPDLVRRVQTPAGDPAWQIDGYRQIKRLLLDPRLGRSHPRPQQASRYSNSTFLGLPRDTDPETERVENARFRRVLSRSFSARRMQALQPRVVELATGLLDQLALGAPPCISTSTSHSRCRCW